MTTQPEVQTPQLILGRGWSPADAQDDAAQKLPAGARVLRVTTVGRIDEHGNRHYVCGVKYGNV